MIIEIGFDLEDESSLNVLKLFLVEYGYTFYIEPANRFLTLEELEAECEGK